jgi:hypothetical protein
MCELSYAGQHQRVHAARGTASAFLCDGCCGRRAQEWAWVHDTDRGDPRNYVPLCRGCHVEYDAPLQRAARWPGLPLGLATHCRDCGVELNDDNRSPVGSRKSLCKDCRNKRFRRHRAARKAAKQEVRHE